jgi:uncharacterized RDD family membrane protein YckC
MFFAVGAPLVWFVAGSGVRNAIGRMLVFKSIELADLGLDPTADGVPLRPLLTMIAILLMVGSWALYRVLSAKRGTSVAKHLLDLAIIDVATGSRGISTARAWKRWAPNQVLALLPVPAIGMLCYVAALWHPKRRGWHDIAAGTMVVRCSR